MIKEDKAKQKRMIERVSRITTGGRGNEKIKRGRSS
jgi:hypothetical protein